VCDGELVDLESAAAAPPHLPRRAIAMPQPLAAS